jgi:eukaryotic-like serine/threonine-protein kinase
MALIARTVLLGLAFKMKAVSWTRLELCYKRTGITRLNDPVRILIIDTSRHYMAYLRHLLAQGLPEVEVSEYDADERGLPDGMFDWRLYDALVMTYELGHKREGYTWLRDLNTMEGFPPTLIIARELDMYHAVAVMRAGAHDVLLAEDVTSHALVSRLAEFSRKRSVSLNTVTLDPIVTDAMATQSGRDRTAVRLGDEQYSFKRLIGQGGMSRAYLTVRESDGALVVIKTVSGARLLNDEMRERFRLEAQLAMAVKNPHVVNVIDFGVSRQLGLIAMEFFPRGDLKRRIESRITQEQALQYLRQIALGIAAIEEAGIVHRDLKPGNIMFKEDDGLALADFGIAKRLGDDRTDTTFGRVVGTPAYFSPEQAKGDPVDTRSDLYSVGVIFFEMLVGSRPFDAPTIESMMYHHVYTAVPPLPRALREFQPLLNLLLAKDPANRLGSAEALVNLIDRGSPQGSER